MLDMQCLMDIGLPVNANRFEELAAMVRLGRLRTHQSEDAFDSAMQGVIERLEPTPSAGIPS